MTTPAVLKAWLRRGRTLLASARGAFDLTSVLVGAAVVAILVGGTAVTTFGVIPWAQDNGATQNLSAVSNAQSVAKVRDGKFTDTEGLTGASYLSAGPSLAVAADTNGSCWVGLSKSDTGKVFYATSSTMDPRPFVSGTTTGCVAKTDLRKLAVAVGAPLPTAKAAGWGVNTYGQIGNGAAAPKAAAETNATGVLAGKSITDISAGKDHSCAVADGKAYCWGASALGNGSNYSYVPVEVGGALAGKTVTDIATGDNHTCAVADGAAYCWGFNNYEQLGTGDTTGQNFPTAVLATGVLATKTVTAVSAGSTHTCVLADGSPFCWGSGNYGQLGDGLSKSSSRPVAVSTTPFLGKPVSSVSVGSAHTCAISDGKAYCWGINSDGRLGIGTGTWPSIPTAVSTSGVLAGKTVTDISAGSNHTCAVASGAAYCWGSNNDGRLGTGNTVSTNVPAAVAGMTLGKTVTSVSTNFNFSCAVADAQAYCWGDNANGQLGDGTTTGSASAVLVTTPSPIATKAVTGISVGQGHTMVFYE